MRHDRSDTFPFEQIAVIKESRTGTPRALSEDEFGSDNAQESFCGSGGPFAGEGVGGRGKRDDYRDTPAKVGTLPAALY